MLKHCTLILLLLAATALFVWMGKCASCTAPELCYWSWQYPARCGVGQPFRLELSAYGGLTPPSDGLFDFNDALPDIAECQRPLSWHPAGICRNGILWKTTLVAWPVNVGLFGGIIATYLPQDDRIPLPITEIEPGGELSPVWLETPQESHQADIALVIALFFSLLPFLIRCKPRKLDAALLEQLRCIRHPVVPCLAFLLTRQTIATYSGHKANLDNLEKHCRKLI